MKATGEVMGIGSNLEEALLKGARCLEIGCCHFHLPKFDNKTTEELLEYIREFRDDNIFAIAELMRRDVSVAQLHEITKITPYFLEAVERIVAMECKLTASKGDLEVFNSCQNLTRNILWVRTVYFYFHVHNCLTA